MMSRVVLAHVLASFCLLSPIANPRFGWGQGDAEYAPRAKGTPLTNATYLVDFDAPSGIAHWVHYALLVSECQGPAERDDAFRADPRIPGCPDHNAYKASGYDRGHLKPAADSKASPSTMRNSFLMTNMAPQTPNLNRGIWKELEEAVRGWAETYGEVHVTCGPGVETYDWLASGVRVPASFWKVVMRTAPDTACLAFVFPNAERVPGDLHHYLVSVDEVESKVGVDVFPALPDGTERRVESDVPARVWAQGAPASALPAAPTSSSSGNTSPSTAPVQCMGIAKSTGQRCRQTTRDPSGYCRYHAPKEAP
jgi:endonuclease G